MEKTKVKLWVRAGMSFELEIEELKNKTPEQIEKLVQAQLDKIHDHVEERLAEVAASFDGDSYVPLECLETVLQPLMSEEQFASFVEYDHLGHEF